MSRSSAATDDRSDGLRRRVLLIVAAVALAGVVGLAEEVSPYEVRVDEAGEDEVRLPEGSLALVVESSPSVGDVAAYSTNGDDLAADRVTSIHDSETGTHYALDHGDRSRPSVVADDQVMGRLVAGYPHLGTLWTVPIEAQVTLKAILVTSYLGLGAYKTGLLRFGGRPGS